MPFCISSGFDFMSTPTVCDTEWANTVVVVVVVVVDVAGRRNNGLYDMKPEILTLFVLATPCNCHMLDVAHHF